MNTNQTGTWWTTRVTDTPLWLGINSHIGVRAPNPVEENPVIRNGMNDGDPSYRTMWTLHHPSMEMPVSTFSPERKRHPHCLSLFLSQSRCLTLWTQSRRTVVFFRFLLGWIRIYFLPWLHLLRCISWFSTFLGWHQFSASHPWQWRIGVLWCISLFPWFLLMRYWNLPVVSWMKRSAENVREDEVWLVMVRRTIKKKMCVCVCVCVCLLRFLVIFELWTFTNRIHSSIIKKEKKGNRHKTRRFLYNYISTQTYTTIFILLWWRTKGVLSAVRDVEKTVLTFLFFVYSRHHRCSGRHLIVHEDKNSLLWRKLYTLPDNIHKLSHCQISRYEILLLIDVRYRRFVRSFTNHWNTIGIFLSNTLCLRLTFLKRMFVLKSWHY